MSSSLLKSLRAAVVAGLVSTSLAAQGPEGLDAEVQRAMREFGVPGVGLAIVRDGQVVVAKGYGVREMGRPEPVTEHTLFQVASNTKAFTSAALAMLVDEGKVSWDDPVIRHLPWFRLHDPYVTRAITLRDLLSHRSGMGLGAGDLIWYRSGYGTREILTRIAALPPANPFRATYAYQNIPFLAAGEVVPAVTGTQWDEFVRRRILARVGMTETRMYAREIPPLGDVAMPHSRFQGSLRVIGRDQMDNAAPAGSMVSSASDLAKWLVVQMDSGRVGRGSDTVRLWSARRTREMWSGQTILPIGTPAPGLEAGAATFSEYGLGWFLRDFKGHKVVTHTGGLGGMVSRTLMVPDRKVGIVILTNSETPAHTALAFWILDRMLGEPSATDWVGGYAAAARKAEADAAETERKAAAERARGTRPSLPVWRYAGRYADPMYGEATVAQEGEALVLRFANSPPFVGTLEHWQHDTFVVRWRDRTIPDAYLTFALTPRGAVRDFTMEAVSPLADFSFDYQDLRFTPVPEARSGG